MTDYNPITEAETDPEAPSKSSLWKRWWKNPIAMFEGASGAPRIQADAFPDFAVGAVEVINWWGAGIVRTVQALASGSSSGTSATGPIFESYIALKAGSLRFSVEAGRTGSNIGPCNIILNKNGTDIATIAVGTTPYVTYTADFSFNAGDAIKSSCNISASGTTGNVTLSFRNAKLLGDQRGLFRL